MQISRFTASQPSKFAFASDEKSIRQPATSFVRCYLNLRRALLAVRSDAQKDYFDEESWKTFAEREQRQAVLEIILEMQQKYSHRLLTAQ